MNGYRKSICFVIPHYVTFSTGGAEIQVHYLANAFLKMGWQVEVVCAGVGHEKEILESEYLNENIKYFYYKKRTIRSLEFWDVLKVLKKTQSHYYYQRTDFAITAATYWYTKSNKKKMIYALANDGDAHKNKYSLYFKDYVYTSLLKKWIRKIDFFLLDKMVEWAKKNVPLVVCQNQSQLKDYKNNFGTQGIIIPNSFELKEAIHEEKQNVILWVGNNNPLKQPQIFVEIAKRFGMYRDWHFVMLGSAREAISMSNLPHNMSVLGEVSYSEANKWFSRASVFINTSSSEGMPNTFIQSWYFNVLVFSLSVNPNHIFDEINAGFCFDNDIEKMCEALVSYIEGKDAETQLINGKQYFNQHFNLNTNVETLINYIHS